MEKQTVADKAEQFVKRFAENVRALVSINDLKLGEIEKNAGVSAGYISKKIKGGREKLTLNSAIGFADALGVDVFDLLQKDYTREFRQKRIAELEEELRILKELEGETTAV